MVKQEPGSHSQGRPKVRFCGACEEGCKAKGCQEQGFRRLGEDAMRSSSLDPVSPERMWEEA
eukprot:5871191-Lingulodinium_polyedra.AAC.1